MSNLNTGTVVALARREAANSSPSLEDTYDATKGNVLVSDGSTFASLPVGTNDQVLTADSTEDGGVAWKDAGGGGGTVQGTDSTYDIRAANEGSMAGDSRADNTVDLQTDRFATTQVASADSATISGGKWNTASGDSSTVGGGRGNIASGSNSTVAGGNGNDATAENASVLGGFSNVAGGIRSGVVCGSGNETGVGGTDAAILGGAGNEANSVYSAVVTGNANDAEGTGAVILTGVSAQTDLDYSVVHGGHGFGVDKGSAQVVNIVLNEETTGSSQTELFLNGSTTRIALIEDDFYAGQIFASAKRDNGDWAYWAPFDIQISRDGSGNVVLVGGITAQAPDTYGNASGVNNGVGNTWDLDVDADTSNQSLRVRFTGASSQTIRIVVSLRLIRIVH